MNLINERISVTGMHCTSCETRIEKTLLKLKGVKTVVVNYCEGYLDIAYDKDLCDKGLIKECILKAGYHLDEPKRNKTIGILVVFAAVFLLANVTNGYDMDARLKDNVSYIMLFVIGLFTSLHCIGMCGGLLLSQSVTSEEAEQGPFATLSPALAYNSGRIISYTVLGGIVGAAGSVISLSLSFKAGLTVFAGVFMVLMGLSMAGFTPLRKFNIKLPWAKYLPQTTGKRPFVVGLVNGLLPCGPLQTMQLFALGTGSAAQGAVAMFIFALGTAPLMLAFGSMTGFLSKDHTQRILKLSGVLVLSLGLIMANRGLAIAGINVPGTNLFGPKSAQGAAAIKAEINDGVQTLRIAANGRGYVPNVLFVQKGIPVRWIIEGQELNSCNNAIIVPSLKIEKKLAPGENIIAFTPANTGEIGFSCWMGMIRGAIRVVDDLSTIDTTAAAPVPSGSGCGSGCCAQPKNANGTAPDKPPIDQLIKKSSLAGAVQTATVVVQKTELSPVLTVIDQSQPAVLNFEFISLANMGEKYTVIEMSSGKELLSFEANSKTTQISIKPENPGLYGVLKNGDLLGGIEVTTDLSKVNLEQLREKYF